MRILKYQVTNTARNVQNTSTFYLEPRLVTTISRLSFLPPPPAQPHFLALLDRHKTALITGTDIQVIFVAEETKSAFFCTAPYHFILKV